VIWRGLSERAALATGHFAKLFGTADIPPLPGLATRLLAMLHDDDADAQQLAQVIANDVGLTAKVLSTVNSAHYGLRHRVTNIQHAIAERAGSGGLKR
jgi:HD-like signal output (HDOD) protein